MDIEVIDNTLHIGVGSFYIPFMVKTGQTLLVQLFPSTLLRALWLCMHRIQWMMLIINS